MGRSVAHLLLDADEVARQQKIQDLPTSVAQRLEAERPPVQQRIEWCVSLAFVNECFAGTEAKRALFQRLHKAYFVGAVGREQRKLPEWALVAGDFLHGTAFLLRDGACATQNMSFYTNGNSGGDYIALDD
jgi:hypothetical protein